MFLSSEDDPKIVDNKTWWKEGFKTCFNSTVLFTKLKQYLDVHQRKTAVLFCGTVFSKKHH